MIKHAFTSGKSDGGDATLVQPSHWNADHTIDDATIAAAKLAADVRWSRAWFGKVYAAYGDCAPGELLQMVQRGTVIAPTPTQVTTTIARCAMFRPPAPITVNRIRYFGTGATTSVFRAAIYRYSDLARLTAELAFTTAVSTWGSAGAALGLTLDAGELYFIACSVNATGTTSGPQSFGTTIAATTGQIPTAPQSLPGNLATFNTGFCFQFAVTAGALPATAPTLAAQAAWLGGMPAFWLDNDNAA